MHSPIYERPKLYEKQRLAFFNDARIACCEASTKSGKAQPLDALIMTPSGYVRMGDIKIGDTVCTPTGNSVVKEIYPQGVKEIYRISFNDGSTAEATADHLWEIWADRRDYRRGFEHRLKAGLVSKRRSDRKGWPRIMTTDQLRRTPDKVLKRFWVKMCDPIEFKNKETILHPYVVGALIGDGGLTGDCVIISSADKHVLDRINAEVGPIYSIRHVSKYDYRITSGNVRPPQKERLTYKLGLLGLMGKYSYEKRIPAEYMSLPITQRWELLQGLFDTDGWVDKMGQPHFDQTSESLCEDVRYLIETLGGSCAVKKTKKGNDRPVYKLTVRHPNSAMFFSLPRKKEKCLARKKPVRRTIRGVDFVREAPAQCIRIESPAGLYLTNHQIVTHNTHGCMCWLLEQALTTGAPGRNYWWVAPVYSQAEIAFERMKKGLPNWLRQTNHSKLYHQITNGARIWFKSAEVPDNLYGENVYAGVFDEASRSRVEAWYALRSTLTHTRGPVRLIGNVRGRANWFYKMCRRAEGGDEGMSYMMITADDAIKAGILSADEIEGAKRDMPVDVFNELYMCKPSDTGVNPFGYNYIQACLIPTLSHMPLFGSGVDLAKSKDWTVVVGLDKSGRMCSFERFQKPWQDTVPAVQAACKKAPALVDSTGVGDPVLESLQAGGHATQYEGFKFSSQSKQMLMEGLAVAIQQQRIGILDGIVRRELESFEYEYTRTGVRYSAPEGLHDDCVVALALAWRQVSAGLGQVPQSTVAARTAPRAVGGRHRYERSFY